MFLLGSSHFKQNAKFVQQMPSFSRTASVLKFEEFNITVERGYIVIIFLKVQLPKLSLPPLEISTQTTVVLK